MCDLFSWGYAMETQGTSNIAKRKKPIFVRDSDVEAYYEVNYAGKDELINWEDVIGHSFIESCLKVKIDPNNHKEGILKVPPLLAQAVNRGECDKMAKKNGWAGIRYDKKGNIDVPWWPKKFIENAKTLNYFDAHSEPLPEWKLFGTRDAAWDVTRDTAWDVTRDTAWAAARKAARNAARKAAWEAARVACDAAWVACDAAWDVARGAARAAAGAAAAADAGLLAICELAFYEDNRTNPNPHLLYARKRWEVYEKGYGLLCDIGGTFYVYKKP